MFVISVIIPAKYILMSAWQRIFTMLTRKSSYGPGNQKHRTQAQSDKQLMMWLKWWLKIYKKTTCFHRN